MIIEKNNHRYETVIGLEVHAQLNTAKKLFSSANNDYSSYQNKNVALFDIATPGKLPILNFEIIEKAISFGIAIEGTINKYSAFDRKHYFYPDSPASYQISQYYLPIITNGSLTIEANNNKKIINIERVHIEQDAGKMMHDRSDDCSYIDYNRAGVPLIEIVSKPDFREPTEVTEYLKKLQAILRFLNVADADLEKGTFRCDANVSVMREGSNIFGTRCEIKNLNSFKFIADAITFEANRQVELIESGQRIAQETRSFNTKLGVTESMRDKESANDYRYMPDPDLLPIIITDETIAQIKSKLPELPDLKRKTYIDLGLQEKEIKFLCSDVIYAEYFDLVAKHHDPKFAATWVLTELIGTLNKHMISLEKSFVTPQLLIELMNNIRDGVVTGKMAKDILEEMILNKKTANEIIATRGLRQIDDISEIEKIVDRVIAQNADKFNELISGNDRLFNFFVGQVMKLSEGKVNPSLANDIIKKKLSS